MTNIQKLAAVLTHLASPRFRHLVIGTTVYFALGVSAQSADAPTPTRSNSNAGHFQIGPFEYFAEERLDQKTPPDPSAPRSRLWLMPTLVLIPESVEVFDALGDSVNPAFESEKSGITEEKPATTPTTTTEMPAGDVVKGKTPPYERPRPTASPANAPKAPSPTPEPRFHGRAVFRLTAPSFSPLTKAVVLAHLRNDRTLRNVPVDDYFYRTLALMDVPQIEAVIKGSPGLEALFTATESLAAGYQMETAITQRVSVTIRCLDGFIGTSSFTPTAMLSSISTVAVDCPSMDRKTAKLFYEGRINTTADMEVSLSNVQIAAAEYDLNTFAEAISKELNNRVTEARSSKKGFLWWGSTRKSVETWMTGSIEQSAVGTSSMRSTIFMRDVSSPRLLDAAMAFIFKPFESATNDRLAIMAADHREAAKKAEEANRKDLAVAHQRYAEYLDTLRKVGENGSSEQASKAMEALEKIFAGKADTGAGGGQTAGGGATTAAAASGNPYVAAAMFIAQGIVYKDDKNSDKMHVVQTRRGVWEETDNKQFSGLIASQAVAGYTVTQGSFPEIGDFRAKINKDESEKSRQPKKFSPRELRNLRKQTAEEVLKSFALQSK